jgi:cystathionine beta-lyase/cystathionine gamma-synthase
MSTFNTYRCQVDRGHLCDHDVCAQQICQNCEYNDSINLFSEDNVIDPITTKYTRSRSSNLADLTNLISSYHGGNKTLITTSGMHAITTTLLAIGIHFNWQNFNIVYSNEMYCDTHRYLQNYLCNVYTKGVEIWPFSVEDVAFVTQLFESHLTGQNNILFIESCSNPNSKIFDFQILPFLRKLSKKLIVIVDNTWLTHEIFNPFDFGTDITVCSLTKYYSGGTTIAGACIFSNQLKYIYDIANKKNTYEGVHIHPAVALHLVSVIPDMKCRLEKSIQNTIKIINGLSDLVQKNGNVVINHPCILSNFSYELAKIYFTHNMYPSVFTITLPCKLQVLKSAYSCDEVADIIPILTSFGASNTRIDPWPSERTFYLESSEVQITHSSLRIAVGYDDENKIEQIIHTIKQIVNTVLQK